MDIILAKSAGFCFGVTRAVNKVNDLINENCKDNLYTYGPIIHNDEVVNRLEKKNVFSCENVSDIKLPARMVIRAHGVAPEVVESIKNLGVGLYDATCPYVKKIHKLVEEKSNDGYTIVIVGDEKHPEVIGIKGWCLNKSVVISDFYKENIDDIKSDKVCVVSQTTLSYKKWDEITEFLRDNIKDIEIYDTICSATHERQKEAEKISKEVEIMFVIGSKKSSNTQKLFDICKENCENTFKIENANELRLELFKNISKVGVTAGASTPDWAIEEVIVKMSELNKEQEEMDFGKYFEESLVTLSNGDIVKGKVIGISNNEVYVDLGYKSDGILPASDFTEDNNVKEVVRVGDEVEAIVLKVNDADGHVLLSKKKIDSMKAWNSVEELYKNKTEINAKATEVVKGGIIASWNSLRIFIPASQISDKFIKDLQEFVGKELRIRILEYNERNRRLVGSQRVILEEEKSNSLSKFWDSVELGKKYEGVIKNITNFGAFVDVGDVDGLIHISDISWEKIKHPSDILKSGQEVEVRVKDFDKEKKKVSFILKKNEDSPWFDFENKYKLDDILDVKVLRLVPFGAFVELEPGIEGLVHVSQISNKRIAKPSDVLQEGQVVKAKLTEINPEAKKISLSIKEVEPIDVKTSDEELEVKE